MSYPPAPGSQSGRAPFNSALSSTTNQRLSYASVVSGTPTVSNHPTGRPGVLPINSNLFVSQSPSHYDWSSQEMAASQFQRGQIPDTWRRTQVEHYSSVLGHIPDVANTLGRSQEFFVPSYLYGSKHIERLERRYKVRMNTQREGRLSRSSVVGSLSASASTASLHKMVPSHRGMTHDIIERPFMPLDEELSPLPSRWSHTDKCAGLDILSSDGLEIKFAGTPKPQDDAAAIKSDHAMPRECGIYYFEVSILGKGKEGQIGVGFSGSKVSLTKLPGWEPESWAYHGDDGYSFCQTVSGKPYAQKFGSSDVIGCGVNFRTGSAFFTKNGVNLGTAFKDIKGQMLYPSVGMKKPGEHVRVNFGQSPFVFDIDRMVALEKDNLMEEINMESPSDFCGQQSETSLQQNLVMQYLAHEGYVETVRLFTEHVHSSSKLLHGTNSVHTISEHNEDPDAVNRQKIRASILTGDVDLALKYTNAHYPSVLQENENIYFKLRCRKFIEMIAKSTELQPPSKAKSSKQYGQVTAKEGATYDRYIDVDNSNDTDRMDIEDSTFLSKQADLVNDALQYGQELQLEFKDDPRREIKQALKDTFALIAYPDARQSSLASLLEADGRISVAEELNGAILVSLGKSSSAALERLYQQTEVLVDELSEDGDIGALINVRLDYLS